MTPPEDDLFREMLLGQFSGNLTLFENVAGGVRNVRAKVGEFSYAAARAFAQGLILDPTVDAAKQRIASDRLGVASFYEVAHDIADQLSAKRSGLPGSNIQFVQRSDGKHEPFLLVASAVLNQIDWMEQNYPEELA